MICVKDPSLMRNDPYECGRLLTRQVPDEETTTRNVFRAGWFGTGAAAAKGGRPAEDLPGGPPGVFRTGVAGEYFLTADPVR